MAETTVAKRLFELMSKDWEDELEEIVVKNDIDINNIQRCGTNTSLLMASIDYNAVKCARKVIKLGADVDKVHQEGWTAFMWACENGVDDIAMVLLEAGANYNFTPADGSTEVPRISATMVNAIVERERRARSEAPQEVEAPKILPKEGWLCMFLTNNGVPEEVAEDCEKKLVNEGIYSPLILALLPQHTFTLEYLTSIGIKTRGLQYLLIGLFTELYQKTCRKWEPLWTQELEEASKVNKKRAHD